MKRLFSAFFLLLAGLAPVPPAAAAMLGDASIPYSAERTVSVDGRSYTGTVVSTPGHQRHEQQLMGMREVFILNTADQRAYLVLPDLKTLVEFPFPALMAELNSPALLRRPVGRDRVAGVPTTVYQVDRRVGDGSRVDGRLWVAPSGALMKLDVNLFHPHGGRPVAIAMQLSHFRPGPQDPRAFDLPQGYSRLPSQALDAFLGGKGG